MFASLHRLTQIYLTGNFPDNKEKDHNNSKSELNLLGEF
jgi:hypothetical protein